MLSCVEDMNHMQPGQGGETDRRAHVVREEQERRAIGDDAAVRRKPVRNRAHGVFTPRPKCRLRPAWLQPPPSEPWVSSPVVTGGLKSPQPFNAVFVEGSRSAEPPVSAGSFGATAFMILPDASRVARPFASAANAGMSAFQPAGNSPRKTALQFRSLFGKSCAYAARRAIPVGFRFCAAHECLPKVCERRRGHEKRRRGRPVRFSLVLRHGRPRPAANRAFVTVLLWAEP